MAKFHKFVHLDLKGAPPRLSYLLSLLPFFKQCGATGVLIEYENTFPYYDELAVLAAPWAYSLDEINQFRYACSQLELEIVPLIQTFGHAEFILHREQFRHLREEENHPNCFCPSHPGTLPLIELMLKQILNVHPDVSTFHIGCDEVSPLGVCASCKQKLNVQTKHGLYLDHVSRVARILKNYQPSMTVIIWDDMIRNAPLEVLQEFGSGSLVEPMVWYYGVEAIPDVFTSYANLFPRVWCASAYKGASGCTETLPNIYVHICNTKLWLSVIQDLLSRNIVVAGIALTGWSRYDYFGVLCELLPTSLPSLVICLRILSSPSGWTQDAHLEASRLLGTDRLVPIDWQPRPQPVITDLRFAGDSVFVGSQHQANLHRRFVQFLNSDLYRGWMHKYNVRRGYVHAGTVKQLGMDAEMLKLEFIQLKNIMTPVMLNIYPSPVIEEWFGEHVDIYVEKLQGIIEKCSRLLQL